MRKRFITWGFAVIGFAMGASSFGLTLQEAVQHTLQTNPEIQAARYETQARKSAVAEARAGYLPELSVSAAVGQERRTAPATGNEQVDMDRQELRLQARQMVFDGSATAAEVARQRARLVSGEYGSQATSEQLALRVVEVYLGVLEGAALLDLAEATLKEHQSIYDQMELRNHSGVGSKADLDQIASRLALANANRVVAQTNLADRKTHFFRLTGVYPNATEMIQPQSTSALPTSRDSALAMAVEDHPQLQSASADVDAAKAQYKAAGSQFWPTVSIEAQKRWDENVGAIEGADDDFVVALRVNYAIYNGGANKSRRQQTAHRMESAKSMRNNTRREVEQNMNLAWNAYEALSAQMPFLEQHVSAASDTKNAYIKQFNIGRRTLLDLLNTENEFVDSQRALMNARYDQLFARYRIFNAAGGLLSSMKLSSAE